MGTDPLARARRWAARPESALGAEAFRALFGLVMFASTLRFVAKGWVQEFYAQPTFHFPWEGLAWLSPPASPWLELHFALIALAAAGIALGLFYRLSAVLFFVSFTSVELWDKTYYLNHYYLVSVLSLWLSVMPLGRHLSIDALRRPARARKLVPRWVRVALRAQLALVYFYAGVAKLGTDWLLRGEPLATWLRVHADLPWLGPLLSLPQTALLLSWAGMLFDLSIGPLLLLRRSRPYAYAAVVVFHGVTGLLLPIGIFPLMMIAFTTVFFAPDWPARPLARLRSSAPGGALRVPSGLRPVSGTVVVLALSLLSLQALVPLRHLLYPGAVNWTEEGFRFSWRVMLIEKTGSVELELVEPDTGRRWLVNPRDELSERQYLMMSTQPDMIQQYARHVAATRRAAGLPPVRVHAHAVASLNGRPACPLIAPEVDLLDSEADWRTPLDCRDERRPLRVASRSRRSPALDR